ncbi:hypothetical protein DTO013E5_5886 [Penicillium roqueforti]|uniref:uncharacterized protein n=1 Tax=Penicillium roqueforti TaxID=5082 RepID=UPI00190A4BB7|nr:uncharacterized protein LCP9604111_7290 [Penicillium roqueforti]KAF9244337.1 hypothetical protein LCP9604111_7290 [Penicillium roqueforti]KAI1835918.1 hypothetical protein CBS147337_3067 [Penicillium roqueforti]KAI2678306.1 hypothetical protein LCP963914a_7737 [Penicillium roqueforti]KAI2682940.1 hypothetical protein CBS147355_2080 [Penicillium roqueforti]KAI2701509.1 hypothetical protein CBS147372_4562 [Penicillium roqueforti]
METFPTDPPRRARRSSISNHIHRVFGKSMDKRHNQNSGFVPPVPFLAREALAHEATDSNSHARHSLYDETGPSSVSYSSNSRLPSTGTPGSSLSVANGAPVENDTPTQQMTPLPIYPDGDGDNISKPTLERPKKKEKEKRVTKRLEAERKELEKRLLALEESQSQGDIGIHDRNSRRLTKKQPVSSSSRSSSANAERPKSSSSLSSIFRRSRRNSRSSDQDPSAEFNQLRTDTNPPSLPLTLPERFGTAITRELQSKHGTALNLSASNKMSNPTQHNRLHATAKSDDLRENWKMAEAWKTAEAWRTKDGHESNRSVSEQIPTVTRSVVGNCARNGETLVSSGDLDKELFSAALKHDRKSMPGAEYPGDRVTRQDRSVRATSMPMSQCLSQPNLYSPGHSDSPTQVTTARQLQEMTPPETPDNPSTLSGAKSYQPLSLAQTNSTGNLARMNRVDPFPRAYKSSPLALNPANTDESAQSYFKIPRSLTLHKPNHENPSQPLHSPGQSHPEDRGRSRLPTALSNTPKRTSSRFKENFHETSQSVEMPPIPVKSERRSLEIRGMPTASTDTVKDIPASPCQVPVRTPVHAGSVSPGERNSRTSKDLSDSNTVPAKSPRRYSHASTGPPEDNILAGEPRGLMPGHSRCPSHNSSHDGHSNYDTADEDAPEPSEFKRDSANRVDTSPAISAVEAPVVHEAPVSPLIQPNTSPGIQPGNQPVLQPIQQPASHPDTYRGIQYGPQYGTHPGMQPSSPPGTQSGSPQARPAPMSILKRRSQKAKTAHSPQTLTKIFVICCRCKYWHDLPSEVYARLACPERLVSDSKVDRTRSKTQPDTGTRKLTGSRSLPFGQLPAAHAAQGMPDLRPAPLLPRKVTCCWCGHNMSRSCCEGWTTVVEMCERHH